MKLLLAAVSGVILARAIAANDAMICAYWCIVCLYWIINFVEGIK